MGVMASQITSLAIVYSNVYSDPDQRKHQSSTSLAFVWGIHRGPVNPPHKWPVTRKMFPFHDPIVFWRKLTCVLMAKCNNTSDNNCDKDNNYNNNCDDNNDDNYDDDDNTNNNNNNNNNKNGLGCIIISLCSSGWMAVVFADQLTSCLYWQALSRGTIIWTSFSVFLVGAASSGFMKN